MYRVILSVIYLYWHIDYGTTKTKQRYICISHNSILFKSCGSEFYFIQVQQENTKNTNRKMYKIYSILEDQLLTMSRETTLVTNHSNILNIIISLRQDKTERCLN